MRRLFHLQKKSDNSHRYYGSLSALCNDNTDLGVSKFTLDRYDFEEKEFENENYIIRKSVMKTTSQIDLKKEGKKILKKLPLKLNRIGQVAMGHNVPQIGEEAETRT